MKIIVAAVGLLVAIACFLIWHIEAKQQERKPQLILVERSIANLASTKARIANIPIRQATESPPDAPVLISAKNNKSPKNTAAKPQNALKPGNGYYTLYQPEAVIDYIKVTIGEQRLYAFSQGKLAMVEIVSTASTGINLPLEAKAEYPHNHLGIFSIVSKDEDAYSQAYDCPMPFAMFFYGGHAIHQTEPKFYYLLGQPASHGCIREGPEIAKWLFLHTPIGTVVEILQSNDDSLFPEPPSLKAAG